MIRNISKVAKPLVVALIGVYFANKFNIFDFITFIPEEKSFDICITVYFAILEILSEFFAKSAYAKFTSEISVVLSLNNTEVSIDSTPIIKFNQSGLAEATITVSIVGRKKHFSDFQLVVANSSFATMQANIHDREVSIDNTGNYIIDLEKMFGNTNSRIYVSSSFRITFAREFSDTERSIEISPELKRKARRNFHPWITFKHNKAFLKVER